MDPLTVLTALIPVFSDGVKSIVHRFTDRGPVPQNVDDAIKMMGASTQQLEALSKMDAVEGPVHTWVNDVRSLQRPVAVVGVLLGFWLHPQSELWSNLAGCAVFYLFGDRTYMYLKGNK